VSGCQIIARVDREVFDPETQKTTKDSRYFISSLDPDKVTPLEVLQYIRDHWQVENCLHWMKDRYWDEDKHYLKKPGTMFAKLTSAALSLLNLMKEPDERVVIRSENVHFAPKETIECLGFKEF
jgi:predicted transposase YbfD/YdcC